MSTRNNNLRLTAAGPPALDGEAGAIAGSDSREPDDTLALAGEARYSQSLDRGLAILMCFDAGRPVLGIADIAEMLGMSRSTTHRYVVTLVALGYLQQGARRKYRLALRVTVLGMAAMNATALGEHARPYLEDLGRRVGYPVGVASLDGSEVVCAESFRGRRAPRLPARFAGAGARAPAHCTAVGKLLVAHLPLAVRHELVASLSLERHGPRTIVSKRALREQLEAIREDGIATAAEELAPQLLALAAPVRDGSREVVAAVGMALRGPASALPALVDELGPHLISTADRIAARLGYRRDDEGGWRGAVAFAGR